MSPRAAASWLLAACGRWPGVVGVSLLCLLVGWVLGFQGLWAGGGTFVGGSRLAAGRARARRSGERTRVRSMVVVAGCAARPVVQRSGWQDAAAMAASWSLPPRSAGDELAPARPVVYDGLCLTR
ncbi:hypothetical protein CMI37_30445 [Candidatus Pacearchaeota archaeon]|nr:hypothetical protein [Candidatus Pacearchaeota archaeon]